MAEYYKRLNDEYRNNNSNNNRSNPENLESSDEVRGLRSVNQIIACESEDVYM